MLKKTIEIWKRLPDNPYEDLIVEARGFRRDLLGDVVAFSVNKINLERQLRAARTQASKNGCLALLAFGMIAIEILGVAIYFLPK